MKSAKLLYVLGQQFALLILTGSLFYMAMKNFKGNYNLNLPTLLMFLGTISFLTFLSKWKKGEKLFQN
jgi:hypothetical protein